MDVSQIQKLAGRARSAQADIESLSQVVIELSNWGRTICIGSCEGGLWNGSLPQEDIEAIAGMLKRSLVERTNRHQRFLDGIASEVAVPGECEQWPDYANQGSER